MGVIADIVGGGGLMFLLKTTSERKNECKNLASSRVLGWITTIYQNLSSGFI